MPITYKVLGSIDASSAGVSTLLYTVPSVTSAVISSLTVCNRNATDTSFRVGIGDAAPAGYLYYDVVIPGNDTFVATLGITLDSAKSIYVYAATTGLSFNLFGSEIT